jgi:hypothetical protein
MNVRPTLERRVTDWLQADAPARAPDRVLAATLDRVAVVGQERSVLSPYRDRSGSSRTLLIAATVALLAVALAAAVFVGGQLLSETAPLPIASAPPVLAPTQPPVPAAPGLGQGPTLQWTRLDVIPPSGIGAEQGATRVAWIGDRFVLVDEDSGTVAVSADGSTWTALRDGEPDGAYFEIMASEDPIASRGGDAVSWSSTPGSGVRIRLSPDATFTADFEGTVDAVGIGPAGIVVSSHVEFDQGAFIESVLGSTWGGDNVASMGLQDGVLSLGARDGRTASVTLADHGVDEAQFDNRGEGWHSLDGKAWTPIPEFPGKVTSIVGTPDGFVAIGDTDTGPRMFQSADAFAWLRMAIAIDGFAEQMINPIMLPWRDGALQTDGTFVFESWTRAGRHVLPMTADVRAREHPLTDESGIGAGPVGILCIDVVAHEILYSPDGIEWRIQAMSDEMAQAATLIRGPRDPDVAVGADAVVALLWENTSDDGARASLWVGTPSR